MEPTLNSPLKERIPTFFWCILKNSRPKFRTRSPCILFFCSDLSVYRSLKSSLYLLLRKFNLCLIPWKVNLKHRRGILYLRSKLCKFIYTILHVLKFYNRLLQYLNCAVFLRMYRVVRINLGIIESINN